MSIFHCLSQKKSQSVFQHIHIDGKHVASTPVSNEKSAVSKDVIQRPGNE